MQLVGWIFFLPLVTILNLEVCILLSQKFLHVPVSDAQWIICLIQEQNFLFPLCPFLGLVQLKTLLCLREICRPLNITRMIKLHGKTKFLYVVCILVAILLAPSHLK